jgi:hypothetical protein
MNSESRQWATVGLSALAVVVIGGLSGLSGCNPHRDQLRPENLFEQIGRQRGQIIEPRKCMLRVAILDRSFHDPSINESVWKAADEQAIAPEARRALQVNGLRIGRITGELPPDLESVLAAPPPHKVEPITFLLDDGEPTIISISEPVDQVSLLLNREDRPYGKDYQAASGYFRVIASHDGTNGVSLRFTPEIHHGPVQRSYQPIVNAAPYVPQQFKINDGQQEETLPDLAANLVLEPGQMAVVGCRPEHQHSLGAFLFTQSDSHADQRRQKLILVWADRNQLGTLGEKAAKTDRPVPSLAPKTKTEDQGKPKASTASTNDSQPERHAGPTDGRTIR